MEKSIYKKVIVFIIALYIYAGSIFAGNIIIAFRNDDISANSNPVYEYQLLQIFHKYGIKPLFAVIPAAGGKELKPGMAIVDSLKSWYLKGWIDIAMHGYTHKDKFAGLHYKIQMQKITNGRKILKDVLGIDTHIFCPPWNAVDKNTLKALKQNSILSFSGYLGEPTLSDMKYLNCNANLFGEGGPLGVFKKKLEIAKNATNDVLLVPLFHSSYDFKEVSFAYLDTLLSNLSNEDERVRIVSFTTLLNDENYSEFLSKANEAGYKLKILENNKYIRKVFMKIPMINNNLTRSIQLAQANYDTGEYQKVIKTYTNLKMMFIIGVGLTIIALTLILILIKRIFIKNV